MRHSKWLSFAFLPLIGAVALSAQQPKTYKAHLSPVPIDVSMQATVAGSGTVTSKAKRKPGRPPGKRRAGRRKGSGTRAAQALSFVKGQPGITIPELAAKMGIKQNYLYRVLPGLEQEGKVSKRGRGWHPKG